MTWKCWPRLWPLRKTGLRKNNALDDERVALNAISSRSTFNEALELLAQGIGEERARMALMRLGLLHIEEGEPLCMNGLYRND